MNNDILWQPSEIFIHQTQMYQFMRFVQDKYHRQHFSNYNELYTWSTQNIASFWESVWQFCSIRARTPYHTALTRGKTMREAQWFSGAQLNFADNLLPRQDSKIAIIAYDEKLRRREITYRALYQQVAALADALKKQGVRTHDRIAAYLPNIPETVIAMLAAASIGAVFSSCSPDFGVQGVIDRFEQIQPKILFAADGQYYHGKTYFLMEKIQAITEKVSSIEKVILVPFIEPSPDISHLKNGILFQDFLTDALTPAFEYLPFNHPLYILYSSGTTGKPKCIVHSAGGTLIQHVKELKLHTNLKEEDCIFYYTTCGWMMWNWAVSSLAAGCTLLLYDGSPAYPHAASLFDIIAKEKVSVFGTSAKYLASLQKDHLNIKKTYDLSALRTILSTGSPLSPDTFDYVYQHIQPSVQLASISGGTDIVSCFALGNPVLPVYRGQLQSRGLGMAVDIYNEAGQPVRGQKGELVCTEPFPSMPIYFWNDPSDKLYQAAYFSKFDGVWAHGDYAEITKQNGLIIYGRSDTVLNPGGVRIGTAEIYRQVEKIEAVVDSVAIGQDWENDIRIILFVKLKSDKILDETLTQSIRKIIRDNASPRHVPAKILQVADIPRTLNGKIAELAVRNVVHHLPIKNLEALANPKSLEAFKDRKELGS